MPQTTQKVVDQRSEPRSQTSKSKLGPLLSLARDKSTVKMNRLIVTLQELEKRNWLFGVRSLHSGLLTVVVPKNGTWYLGN